MKVLQVATDRRGLAMAAGEHRDGAGVDGAGRPASQTREERRAEALRANLRRRKAQMRERAGAGAASDASAAEDEAGR